MSKVEIVALVRVVIVIGLVVFAAVLATPKNKIPLALRGLARILGRPQPSGAEIAVPFWKKLVAFLLVIVAFILAKI